MSDKGRFQDLSERDVGTNLQERGKVVPAGHAVSDSNQQPEAGKVHLEQPAHLPSQTLMCRKFVCEGQTKQNPIHLGMLLISDDF